MAVLPGLPAAAQSALDRPRHCRVCGSSSGQCFSANQFDWLRCRDCGTTQKRLTHREYLQLNPSYDPGTFLDSQSQHDVERYLDVTGGTAALSRAIARYLVRPGADGTPRSFLDVGCGMGRYMLAAQKLGFEMLGFEPSTDHARVAMRHFNLPVIQDYFSPDKVADRKFDLIMLSHVIEHIYDQRAFVQDLVSVLKPGGALIIVTPNNESLLARTTGMLWPMLKPIDHVSLIGSRAYAHFGLEGMVDVHHGTSEYPFEYVASFMSGFRSWVRSPGVPQSSNTAASAAEKPSPLRTFSVKAKVLRLALITASAPMYLAAIVTDRQACLTSVLVRKAQSFST
jgi:SAM-dependent methyltransferase